MIKCKKCNNEIDLSEVLVEVDTTVQFFWDADDSIIDAYENMLNEGSELCYPLKFVFKCSECYEIFHRGNAVDNPMYMITKKDIVK